MRRRFERAALLLGASERPPDDPPHHSRQRIAIPQTHPMELMIALLYVAEGASVALNGLVAVG